MTPTPFSILIVDDSLADANLLTQAFKHLRIDISVYKLSDSRMIPSYLDHKSPLQELRELRHPSLLILQVAMPHYCGLEILQWIRQETRFDPMIVIMIGSRDDPFERARYADAGANAYFVRPLVDTGFNTLAQDILDFCRPPSITRNHDHQDKEYAGELLKCEGTP